MVLVYLRWKIYILVPKKEKIIQMVSTYVFLIGSKGKNIYNRSLEKSVIFFLRKNNFLFNKKRRKTLCWKEKRNYFPRKKNVGKGGKEAFWFEQKKKKKGKKKNQSLGNKVSVWEKNIFLLRTKL